MLFLTYLKACDTAIPSLLSVYFLNGSFFGCLRHYLCEVDTSYWMASGRVLSPLKKEES